MINYVARGTLSLMFRDVPRHLRLWLIAKCYKHYIGEESVCRCQKWYKPMPPSSVSYSWSQTTSTTDTTSNPKGSLI